AQNLDAYDDEEAPSRVIVGVDASQNSAHAAAWAAREAILRGVPLTLVHALELPSASPFETPQYAEHRRADGQRLLDAVATTVCRRFPGLDATTELSDLPAARTLSA